ncbi:MAG: glycosyltransferase family 4 protein [Deltaproteobacteria bacterium]|nr:glycosyltransferase family 4 protein [Deltaproteobacteria bacterium]MBW2673359.1 glycosyltransferase family 4 protein [Deltaproteobacteria bacterium]
MKKIAFAIEKFSRYAGGAESYAVSLATTLIAQGWEVHLFGEAWDGEPEAAIFHRIPIPRYLPAWLKIALFALRHRRAVRNQDFDVIMGFGNTVYMNVYQSHGGVHQISTERKVYSERSAMKRALKRLTIVLSPKQWMRAWIESAPFRLDPRPEIVAIAHMIQRDMESVFHVSSSDIHVVYNGVDTSRYNRNLRDTVRGPLRKRLGIQDDEVVFLFVSYDLKKKGIEPLIEAAFQLKDSAHDRFRIIIVGGLPSRSLARRIKRLHLEDTILFTGPVRSTDQYYANSDVFVLPTYYDACSLVVIEAMACSLPPITTTANGAAGIIADGRDGFVIPHPPESPDLAEKMRVFFDGEKRQQMSHEASRVGHQYSLQKNHQEMIRIFDDIAASKNPD